MAERNRNIGKSIISVVILLAACFAVGYAAGTLLGKMIRKNKEKAECIERSAITVEDGVMTPEVLLSLGRLSDPQISPDGTQVLYGVSYTSIEENRSCRNIFLCGTDGGDGVQLTHSGSSISNARWSPDGRSIFYLMDGQLWKAPLKDGKLGRGKKLSDVEGGIGEFTLSPDGNSIIYTGTIPGPVKTPSDSDPLLSKAEAYVTEDLMYRHWDHWVTDTPRSYVATLVNGTVTKDRSIDLLGDEPFELPTEPFSGIEQLCWSPDGRHIAYSCRKKTGLEYAFSTDTDIYVYCILTGETRRITEGGGYDTDPVWSPDGKHLAWVSMERDGYEADKQRLFVCDIERDGDGEGQSFGIRTSPARELSSAFKYDVNGPVWAPSSDLIYFHSITEGTGKIYSVDLNGSVAQLTGDDLWFGFSSPWGFREDGEGGLTLLASYDCMNFPTELVAVDLKKDGTAIRRITTENDHILSQLDDIGCESRMIPTVDGKLMQTWVLYPPKFDPSKKYPAILITLGGPQDSNSQDWSYRWCYRLMAQQGYIVILPNRRGTTAFGQEWKEQISGDYIGLNMQDYLSAARTLKAEPYVGKMAACGASYGGYSVYYLAGIHGDVFDCFIAHAGIFNEEQMWYTTEEMWFPNWDNGGLGEGEVIAGVRQGGAPYSDLPKARRHYANSPETGVRVWHTPILCIHGGMDFRIPYEQGMAAFNAAQMMGVPSKLVVFPNENHWILQPQNALFWHRTYFDWLDKWLKD